MHIGFRGAVTGLGLALLAGGVAVGPAPSDAASLPAFTTPTRVDDPKLASNANEPATAVDKNGLRYVAYQGGSQLAVSADGGRTWTHRGGAEALTKNLSGCTSAADVGDVELATDRTGRVYFADLQATVGAPDTGVQPVVATSDDGFTTYAGSCAAHQVFSVDREWMAAFTPAGKGATESRVYLAYHDFGPDAMWVNASKDGGKTWSLPVDIVTDPLPALNSLCDTIPGGIAVDPNTGWVYVAWAAGAGPLTNAGTGCNYTQGTVFSNIYVAVSKDEGATWKTTLAFAGPDYTQPEPGDTSELFSTIAVDRAGAVHVAFTDFLDGEFGVYYATSPKADSAGALSFSTAKKVSTPDAHTAYFPRLVAGDSGRVDLIYLGTSVKNVTATAANKAAFNTDTPGQPNCSPEADTDLQGIRFPGKPCQLPGEAQWFLYMAQTLDGGGSWTNQKLRPDPMHMGDICTLGIFCLFGDDRDLADVNDVRIDATGGAQVAYTYEPAKKDHTEVDFQCQTGGPGLLAGVEVRSCLEPASLSNPPTTLLGGHGGGGTGTMPATGGDRRLAVAGSALLLLALALRALRPRAQPF